MEPRRRFRELGPVVVGLLLSAFCFSVWPLPEVNAYTNAFVVCGGSEAAYTTTTVTQNLGCTTQAYVTLIVVQVICSNPQASGSGIEPYQSSPSNQVIKITDTTGNKWSRAAISLRSFGWDMETWFTDAVKSTPSTDSVSVFFASVPNNCSVRFYQADTYAYLFNVATAGVGYPGDLYCLNSVLSCQGQSSPAPQLKSYTLNFGVFTPSNSLVFQALAVNGTFGGGAGWTLDSSMTTVKTQDWGAGIQYSVGGVFQNTATSHVYTGKWAWSSGSGHVFAQGVVVVFATGSGSKPTSCTQCVKVVGGNITFTPSGGITRFYFMSNTTFLYPVSVTNGAVLHQNITTRIASSTLTNGQTSAKLTLGLYMVGSQGNLSSGNLSPVGAGNPMNLLTSYTWTVPTGTNNKTYSFIPNYQVQNGTQFAISLSVNHQGFRIYETGTSITMYQDSNDGYNPSTINGFSSFSPAFYLAAQVLTQQYVTVSGVSVFALTTVTSIAAAVVNGPDPANSNWQSQFLWIFGTLGLAMAISVMVEIPGSALITLVTGVTALSLSIGSYAQLIPFPFAAVAWVSVIFSFFMLGDEGGTIVAAS